MNNNIGTTFVPVVVPLPDPTGVSTIIASAVATAAATIAASWDGWRLFQGHSEWYLWDQDLRNKNYKDLIAITAKWYKNGGINNKDLNEAASDQAPNYQGVPRYKLLPMIYTATNDNFIGLLIAEFANIGALPSSAVPQEIRNQLKPITSNTNPIFQSNPNNGGGVLPSVTTATTSTSSLLLYGGIALGIILLLQNKK